MSNERDQKKDAVQTRLWITVIIGGLMAIELGWPYTSAYTVMGGFVGGAFTIGVVAAAAAQFFNLGNNRDLTETVPSWWKTIGWLAAFYIGIKWFM